MRDQCHSGKWQEDEVQEKRICKNEVARCTYGETYQSHVRASIYEKPFERIKDCLQGYHHGRIQDKMMILKMELV